MFTRRFLNRTLCNFFVFCCCFFLANSLVAVESCAEWLVCGWRREPWTRRFFEFSHSRESLALRTVANWKPIFSSDARRHHCFICSVVLRYGPRNFKGPNSYRLRYLLNIISFYIFSFFLKQIANEKILKFALIKMIQFDRFLNFKIYA